MVKQDAWINTQHGRLVQGQSRLVGTETVAVGGEPVACEHYAIRGDVNSGPLVQRSRLDPARVYGRRRQPHPLRAAPGERRRVAAASHAGVTSALRVVLGDQLNRSVSSLRDLDPSSDRVLIAEVADEATYVPHHPKKIAFLFAAMRHFAMDARSGGHRRRLRAARRFAERRQPDRRGRSRARTPRPRARRRHRARRMAGATDDRRLERRGRCAGRGAAPTTASSVPWPSSIAGPMVASSFGWSGSTGSCASAPGC